MKVVGCGVVMFKDVKLVKLKYGNWKVVEGDCMFDSVVEYCWW